jgi:uncharacterized repeat protein (TIGR01451 family)
MKKQSLGFRIKFFSVIGAIFIFSALNAFAQIPPGKLTRQEIERPNPLRVSQPTAMPGVIRQTAMQSEDAQFPAPVGWDVPLAAPSQSSASALSTSTSPADPFPAATPPSGFETPFPPLSEPVAAPPLNNIPFHDSDNRYSLPSAEFPQTTPSLTSSLSSADPFANRQPEAAVPTNALPSGQPRAEYRFNDEQPRTASNVPASPMRQSPSEGTGLPGATTLEGPQTPFLALQKVLPTEVVINQPATFKTVIQNVGKSVAKNVIITDRIPQGTRLISTIPEAVVSPDGELRWSVGNLDPNGGQLVIEMKVIPLREGEIGSVASVHYTGEASGRIVVTRPMLKLEVKAPAEVRLGEIANVEIIVTNPGTATVTNLILEARIPEGLYHQDGRVIEHKGITVLRPKESKRLALPLTCIGAGNLVNHIIVTADGNLKVEDKAAIRASAPILNLEIVGAKTRFLERRSDFRLIVANKGNAPAYNVGLELKLPAAVQFISTNQSGVYDQAAHSVHWALEELPPQEAGEIELVLLPAHKGEHSLRFIGTGENNLKAEAVLPISIDGLPALTFEIVGDSNLVEIGKDATYEVRVTNRGTSTAANVKVRVALAEGMSFVKAEGGRYQAGSNGIVQFETIPLLGAKSEHVYRFSARCLTEGDHRLNVQVISDDLRLPITKEESTRVFK